MSLRPGTRIGPYDVIALIGEGGMGEVWRAHHTALNRDDALKVLPDAFVSDSERLARFRREAQVLASLNHPHIAHVYGLEHSDGVQALVMELVEGPTLADRIAKGPIPLDEALPIATQIAHALEAAHERSIVHRDLKPANIKLRDDGTVKVLDFGLAKALGSDGGAAPAEVSHSPTITSPAIMTGVGVLLGTAAYMAPEQARGKPVDKRADIWAFGCVLFEMLTGKRAFGGDEVSDTLAIILTKDIDWTALPRTTPQAVRHVLRRCLEKNPAKRLHDIADARIEINEANAEPSAVAQSASASPEHRARLIVPWVVAAVAIATAGVLGTLILRHREPASLGEVRFAIVASEDLVFGNPTFGRGTSAPAPHFAPSPDGKQIAYVAYKADQKARLWVRRLDTLSTTALPGSDDASFPFWSPDSRFLAFFAQGKLKRIDVSGGPPLTICDAPAGEGGTWNRDDVIVFAPEERNGLFRVSATSGGATPLTKLDATRGEYTHRWPQFLPDGRHFLYLAMTTDTLADPKGTGSFDSQPAIYVGSLDSAARTPILRGSLRAMYGGGYLLFLRDATLMAQPFDPRAQRLSGDPVPIAEGIANNTGNGRTGFNVSDGGVLTYRTGLEIGRRSVLTWVDRTGKRLATVGAPADYLEVQLSPDARTVAAVIASPRGNSVILPGPQPADLWLLDLARNAIAARLTFQADQPKLGIAWSPDGNRVVFGASDAARFGIFAQRTTGIGDIEQLFTSEAPLRPTSWSSDGRYVAFTQRSVGRSHNDLSILPTFGGGKAAALLQSTFNHQSGVFSPNGRWIAYVSDQSGTLDVYVRAFPTGDREWRISQNGGDFPQWRADGRELFYQAQTGGIMAVPIGSAATFDPGTPVKLDLPPRPAGFYSVSPDGQRFLGIEPVAVADQRTSAAQAPIQVILNWQEELMTRGLAK